MAQQCDGCTLCCYLFPVPDMDKGAVEKCRECVLNVGCRIYNSRPKGCRGFQCAYLQMDKVSIQLRPDKCKVVFEKINDDIFFGTQDPRFEMTEIAKKQIKAFNNQGFSVIIYTPRKGRVMYLAHGHTQEQIMKEVKNYLEIKQKSM